MQSRELSRILGTTYRELQEWGCNAPVNDYGITFSPKDERHTIKIYGDGRQMELCRVHDDYIESFRCIVFANSGIRNNYT